MARALGRWRPTIGAGAAPLYRGEPGYRAALDPDGDGIACEQG